MAVDSISISALRARATALRLQADEIDKRVDAIVALMEELEIPVDVGKPIMRSRAAGSDGQRANKGKQPGTLSMRWRSHFRCIHDVAGRDGFPIGLVQDVLKEREHREPRPSEVRRLFDGYADHGYVERTEPDVYRLSDKLLALIGAGQETEGDVHPARNENEASSGETADASEANGWGVSPPEPFKVKPNPWPAA